MKLKAALLAVATAFAPRATAAPTDFESYGPYVSQNEGLRLSPYLDTAGHYTVGIGHRLLKHEAVKVYTLEEVHLLFKKDLFVALQDAKVLVPSFDTQPLPVRQVLVDMSFQLGHDRLSKFKRMLHSINYGDYQAAASDIRFSHYHKQTTSRAERNIARLNSVP